MVVFRNVGKSFITWFVNDVSFYYCCPPITRINLIISLFYLFILIIFLEKNQHKFQESSTKSFNFEKYKAEIVINVTIFWKIILLVHVVKQKMTYVVVRLCMRQTLTGAIWYKSRVPLSQEQNFLHANLKCQSAAH